MSRETLDEKGYIKSIESFYQAYQLKGAYETASAVMANRDWIISNAEFDPVTSHALTSSIDQLAAKRTAGLQMDSAEATSYDWVHRICDHTYEAVKHISDHMRSVIVREQRMMPAYRAKEMDSSSILWLSKKPGRTVREKLSGNPNMKAVARRHSLDTLENRLFKAFAKRLDEILAEREMIMQPADDIYETMSMFLRRWLRSDMADAIGIWQNMTPNNTLLQDRNYRKVWDGWLMLRKLDELVEHDVLTLPDKTMTRLFWTLVSKLAGYEECRLVQQPISIDYEAMVFNTVTSIKGQWHMDPYLNRHRGQIGQILHEKGFGSIRNQVYSRLFFHKSEVNGGEGFAALSIGDEVVFDLGNNAKGPCAVKIVPEEILQNEAARAFELRYDSNRISYLEKDHHFEIIREGMHLRVEDIKGNHLIAQWLVGKSVEPIINSFLKAIDPNISVLHVQDCLTNPEQAQRAVIDLCRLRPQYYLEGRSKKMPFRLLNQIWDSSDGSRTDMGYSKAIEMNPSSTLIGMKQLITEETLDQSQRHTIASEFIERVHGKLPVKKLAYIVPDGVDDFTFEAIRSSINLRYDGSEPIPRSIAGVIGMQNSAKFAAIKDMMPLTVIAVDIHGDRLSVTPIRARYSDDKVYLDDKLPQMAGIIWERHPSSFIGKGDGLNSVVSHLQSKGCGNPRRLLNIIGLDGQKSESNRLSVYSEDKWYSLTDKDYDEGIKSIKWVLDSASIRAVMKPIETSASEKVLVMALDPSLSQMVIPEKMVLVRQWDQLVEGGDTLICWQDQADGHVLWKDHLPKLSMEVLGHNGLMDFQLVKEGHSIEPGSVAKRIPIEETFDLPEGKKNYRFGLRQGQGQDKMNYEAFLHSTAFPLKDNVRCRLELTYTYGEDNPYQLKFIPINQESAGFRSAHVRWRPVTELSAEEISNLAVPTFPEGHDWLSLREFIGRKGNKVELFTWLMSTLDLLEDVISLPPTKESVKTDMEMRFNHRLSGEVVRYGYDKNHKHYVIAECDGETYFCHSSYYEGHVKLDEIREGMILSFEVDTRNGDSGREVLFGSPSIEVYSGLYRRRIHRSYVKRFRDMTFPLLTIFKNDISLVEADVPDDFRLKIYRSAELALSMIQDNYSVSPHKEVREVMYRFLCALNKDMPSAMSQRLIELDIQGDEWKDHARDIAFAVGNISTDWQRTILVKFMAALRHKKLACEALESLAVIVWRSRDNLGHMNPNEIMRIREALLSHLKKDLLVLSAPNRPSNLGALCRHLELLLALVRTRRSRDERIMKCLLPNSQSTFAFIEVCEAISQEVRRQQIELKFRVDITIDKPEGYEDVSDFLYALRVYLSGVDGADAIRIVGISDE